MPLETLKLILDACILSYFWKEEESKMKVFKNSMHRLDVNKKMSLKGQGHLSKVTLRKQHFCYPVVELFSFTEIRNKMGKLEHRGTVIFAGLIGDESLYFQRQ